MSITTTSTTPEIPDLYLTPCPIWDNAPFLEVGHEPITKDMLKALFSRIPAKAKASARPARQKLPKGQQTAFAGVWRGV